MEKTILIAGIPGALHTEILQEGLSKRFKTSVAIDPDVKTPPIGEDWEKLLRYFPWNKRSPLSAKNLVYEVFGNTESLDEVFLVFEPPNEGNPLHETSAAEMERILDEWVKSFLFLAKEIIIQFQKRKKGLVTLVQYEPEPIILPLSLGISSFYRTMGNALFAQYQNEPFSLRGFLSTSKDVKDFAHFLLSEREKPEKTFGRWTKHSGKGSFWSFGRG